MIHATDKTALKKKKNNLAAALYRRRKVEKDKQTFETFDSLKKRNEELKRMFEENESCIRRLRALTQ
jgi:hypothetical protein